MNLENAFKDFVLQYMQDSEVTDIIKKLVNTEIENRINSLSPNNDSWHKTEEYEQLVLKCQSLEAENSRLLSRIQTVEAEKKQLLSQIKTLEEEKTQLSIRNESFLCEIGKVKSDYEFLKNQYAEFSSFIKMWSDIKRLNDENRDYLEKLCGSVSAESVLSLGRDIGKVKQLWDYLRDLAVGGKQVEEQIAILAGYFEFCIQLSNMVGDDKEQYGIFDIEAGEEFDTGMCIKTAGSKQIGTVSRTIVRGVKEGEKVCFQPIVCVE